MYYYFNKNGKTTYIFIYIYIYVCVCVCVYILLNETVHVIKIQKKTISQYSAIKIKRKYKPIWHENLYRM